MTSSRDLLLSTVLIGGILHVVAGMTTLQYDVTTMATNVTANETVCYCPCEELELAANRSASAPATQEEAVIAGQILQEQLRIDKTNLSSSARKKTSAPDDRPSAQGIGAVGVVVLVSVVVSIVALDLSTLLGDVRMAARRLCGTNDRRPRHHKTQGKRQADLDARAVYCTDAVMPPAVPPYSHTYPTRGLESPDPDEGIGEDLDDGDDRKILTRSEGQDRHGNAPDIRSRRELLEMNSLSQ